MIEQIKAVVFDNNEVESHFLSTHVALSPLLANQDSNSIKKDKIDRFSEQFVSWSRRTPANSLMENWSRQSWSNMTWNNEECQA